MSALTAGMKPTKAEIQDYYIDKADEKLFEALRCWPHEEAKKKRLIQESRGWAKKADQ